MQPTLENFSLKQDNGGDLNFRGRLFSECPWVDESTNELVKQKLYVTAENDQVYYMVRSSGDKKTRHAYRYSVDGDNCIVNNGKDVVSLHFNELMQVMRGMIGVAEGEVPTLSEIDAAEESKIMNM